MSASDLDPGLAELARAHGIAPTFHDWRGSDVHVSAAAAVAVLAALGVDASTADAVQQSLADARDQHWRRTLPPYVVAPVGRTTRVPVHVPDGASVRVDVEFEDGSGQHLDQLMVWVEPREIDGVRVGEATFEVPGALPTGYHRLIARTDDGDSRALLIVAPDRLPDLANKGWGFMLQLYAVHSQASWGIGDLGDLAGIVGWSGRELGASFTLINPLHAAEPIPCMQPSPYFPASRRFTNPVYLSVGDVPEVKQLPATVVTAASEAFAGTLPDQIDRDAAWSAKRSVLERAFILTATEARAREFAAFRQREGQSLVDFATWCALADDYGLPWREWPVELRVARSAAVEKFRTDHAERVAFHCWLQWQCDEQLAKVQDAALDAGMAIGVVQDLAVGVSPLGADAWSLAGVLAAGVTLGAPADIYNQQGQGWNLPPWRPDTLAAADFGPFRELVATAIRHAGGLRVDHIIGLFRQWWVPDGSGPADGAYVRLDHEAMVGIVLIEAQRAGAVIIGEDLGNVEPWVRDYLRDRGILGTSILFFEHGDDGQPRPPEQWRPACLATVTTHDLPPTAGYLMGEHVELRARLGVLERPVEQERSDDEAARLHWLRALADRGLLDPGVVDAVAGQVGKPAFTELLEPHLDAVVDAVHAYLALTPAALVGIYLPDTAGDRRPVNQPGTIDEYPNWRVPMSDATGAAVLLESIADGDRARRLAQLVTGREASVTVAMSMSADRDFDPVSAPDTPRQP